MANASSQVDHLTAVLRSLTSGVDPGRLLQEIAVGAARAAGGAHGVIAGPVEGSTCTLAQVGSTPTAVCVAAEMAVTKERPARATRGNPPVHAAAEPIRIGSRVVGALAVGGAQPIDARVLPAFAAAAGVILMHRPAAASTGPTVEALDAVAQIAVDPDEARILVRSFVAAERLFGATGGFCAVTDGDAIRIAHLRGIERSRMRGASRRSEFRAFITSPGVRVDAASHPVVASLTTGVPTAVGLPLVLGERRFGQLVLLVADAPRPDVRALMEAFASHVALNLRSAEIQRSASEKEEELASVVHAIDNPILVADDRGRLDLVNGAAAELFHLSAVFEAGKPARGRLGHELLEQMLAGDAAGPADVVLGTPEPRVYRAHVANVHVGTGRKSGRVLVLDDVTRTAEAAQLKQDFVGVVGHELRTPLTVMKGYLGLLGSGAALTAETTATALDALSRSTERLSRLVEDLLFSAELDTTRPSLDLAEVDMRSLLAPLAGERVHVLCPDGPVRASVDHQKVHRVLSHLVDNALKYSGTEVTVELHDRGDEIELGVRDAGDGIFSGDIPKLFERFHQLDASSTRGNGGTGIGLYLCRRMIELHGGRIWCESRLGVGTRFAFRLPKNAHPQSIPA